MNPEGEWTPIRREGRRVRAHARAARSHPRLRRALLLGAALVLMSSAATLAFGGRRIAAEESAFIGPAATACVPSTVDRTDLLPGTQLAVSPLPDSLDASRHTQISLLGVPSSAISDV
ncbi:MAG TPA: hypothetical protein VGI76_01300, partial [Solirubrobacteraceae bacterium]